MLILLELDKVSLCCSKRSYLIVHTTAVVVTCKNHKFPPLVPLVTTFPIIPESKLQQLNDQWRRLAIVTLLFDKEEDMEPEEYWGELFQVKDWASAC